MRTTFGQPHFINDVMENFYRFVGEANNERIQNRSGFYKVPRRIEIAHDLPREDSGKIFKRKLREPFWAGLERRI